MADLSVQGLDDVNAPSAAIELNVAIAECKNGVIVAHSDPASGMELGAELSDDDVPGAHPLPAKAFHATSLTVRVATVTG